MELKNLNKNYELVKRLSRIPGKIVSLHGRDNITEFVLHDLSGISCFNFSKAGYFVDNPDFDHLKGMAGYNSTQAFEHAHAIWDHADHFTRHMQGAPFNKQVRDVTRASPKKGCYQIQGIVDDVAQELGMNKAQFFCWDMKHNNHGLFVYELEDGNGHWEPEDLMSGLHLLSLCPIF